MNHILIISVRACCVGYVLLYFFLFPLSSLAKILSELVKTICLEAHKVLTLLSSWQEITLWKELEGDDSLQGDSGDDNLRGGPGNDNLRGGPGKDTFSCGAW